MVIKYDEKSCGTVVFREHEGERYFLLLHYPGGHWDFPKGHQEARDKNDVDTALRELYEETGISDLAIVEGFKYKISYRYHNGEKLSHKVVYFFLGKTKTSKIKISFEHKKAVWLKYEDALKKITHKNSKNLLTKANEFC